MLFPESDRLEFERNPLQEVIWQLRFPKILSILAKPPADFQDRIRAQYPIYDTQGSKPPAQISEALTQMGLEFEGNMTHRFRSQNRELTISLSDDFVAVSASRYRDWGEFRTQIDTAFESLIATYSPSFFSRVGLRYVNLIKRKELELADVPWRELINQEWIGPLVGDEMSEAITELRAHTVVRLPQKGMAKIQYGLQDKDTFRIDSDFYLEGQLDGQEAAGILDDFNSAIGNLFRSAIRDRLRDALRPRPAE